MLVSFQAPVQICFRRLNFTCKLSASSSLRAAIDAVRLFQDLVRFGGHEPSAGKVRGKAVADDSRNELLLSGTGHRSPPDSSSVFWKGDVLNYILYSSIHLCVYLVVHHLPLQK